MIKTGYFRLRDDELQLPDKRIFKHYYVFDFVDWVNVVPVTTDGNLILIEQYRHAVEEVCLEIPGGATDPRKSESSEEAARRELIEETGFVPSSMRLLGKQHPNPALMSNGLWSYLALGCEKKMEQQLDEFEVIDVLTVPIPEVFKLVEQGKIRHSMVIAALHLAWPHLQEFIR